MENNNKNVVVPENVIPSWNDVSNWCSKNVGENFSLIGFEKIDGKIIAQLE